MKKVGGDFIEIKGASQNNLKKIDVQIPLQKFSVICGPSGSGKSSLAFETLYAEGQRRYTQTLSNYARQFIKEAAKPQVQSIKNIPPPILLGQRNNIRSSRSTAATHSEVMDHLRLIFSKVGKIQCPTHKVDLKKYSSNEGAKEVVKKFKSQTKGFILFPIKKGAKTSHLFRQLMQDGFFRMASFKKNKILIQDLSQPLLNKDCYILVDRVSFSSQQRISDSLNQAYQATVKYNKNLIYGESLVVTLENDSLFLSERPACPLCRYFFPTVITPSFFSFNSPLGACFDCQGFGNILSIDEKKIIPNPSLTIAEGAVHIFSTPSTSFERRKLGLFCKQKKINVHTPWAELKKSQKEAIFKGDQNFFGIRGFFKILEKKKYKMHVRILLARYKTPKKCSTCKGHRLRSESEQILFQNMSLSEWSNLTFLEFEKKLRSTRLSSFEQQMIEEAFFMLKRKVAFINQIGLGYLQLNRPIRTLSGGELQRLTLAGELGLGLSQILYILDEPTIGLHGQDSQRLIQILKNLQAHGNTVVVIEHDPDMILEGDHVIEMGPASGTQGGRIIFNGDLSSFLRNKKSLTASCLKSKNKKLFQKRDVNSRFHKYFLTFKKCRTHNLKNIDVRIPLNRLVFCSGVSGSGKSSLVTETIYPCLKKILENKKYLLSKIKKSKDPLFKIQLDQFSFFEDVQARSIEGFERIKQVSLIDQSPAEKTVRSLVATYIGIYTSIRKLMEEASLDQRKPFRARDFSLNTGEGRCSYCHGLGYQEIEMIFMDPIRMTCDECLGKRFSSPILEVQFENKNIDQILKLTVEEAGDFFKSYPFIFSNLNILKKVGLHYLTLGQNLSSLSGGESQRLKLARELSSSKIKDTFYILDEPSTGLHFKEVELLLKVLHQLVSEGASVFVIEHNLQMISSGDYIIDLGPQAGQDGGLIVGQGSLKNFIKKNQGATSQCLRAYLNQ